MDISEIDDPWFGQGPWGPLPRTAKGPASTVFITLITLLVVGSVVGTVVEAIASGGRWG